MFNKPKTNVCPLIKDTCMGASCAWYTTVMGKNPQSGSDINMADCAVKWLPTLLIENSKVGRETGAAVESFRNEMKVANNAIALSVMETSHNLLRG